MKKVLITVGILMLLIISVLVAIPMLFQEELQNLVMDEANKTVNAKIEMSDFELSLIPNFPQLTVTITGMKVSGIDKFDGVTLFGAQTITSTVDVVKLFNGNIEINEVGISGVDVNVFVLKDGTANYDIAKADDEAVEVVEEEVEESESTDFKMSLKRYFIHDFNLVYDDQQGDMRFEIKNMDHDGKGDFTLAEFILETTTNIEEMNFVMEGDNYLKSASLNSEINIAMDMDHMRFQFDTTFMKLNALQLNMDGWLAMPGDSIDMDLKLFTNNNSFKELFSLVPNAYTADFDDVKVKGTMKATADFKGVYYEDLMPAFDINLLVQNGTVQYPDLPASAEEIEINLDVVSPAGDMSEMLVDLKKAHLELADNYFDLEVLVKNAMTNPAMSGIFKMDFDLTTIPTMMPVEEGEEYTGKMKADVNFKADLESIDQEQYDKIEAHGDFEAWDIAYDDGSGGIPMNISHIKMAFDMNKVDLSAFDAMVGQSDVHATGGLQNFIPWYMTEDTLLATLNFNSYYFNVDEWMEDEEETSTVETADTVVVVDSTSTETYEIPTNIDFTMNSNMEMIAYDNMKIQDLKGTILIKEGQVIFKNANVKMFEGTASMNGVFDPTTTPVNPKFDFKMVINDWNIKQVANTFNTVDKLAPILKTTDGTFSTDMTIDGVLDQNLEPVLNDLSFYGVSKTKDVLVQSNSLEKLNGITKTTNFNPLKAGDVSFSYVCKDGVLEIEPFDIKMGTQKATVSGTTTLDEDINYLIDTKIKTADMGAGADELMGQISGLLSSNGVDAKMPEEIPVKISVTGKVTEPVFKPVFGKGTGSAAVKDQVKEIVKEKIEEVKEDLKKEAQAEADKIMADAKKQQDAIMAEARKQADNLNKEADRAGKLIRDEADKQANDLVKQATNPLTKIAAQKGGEQLRKEADKKAKQLRVESDKQGQKVIAEAKKKSDKILADAKAKSDAKLQGL